MPLQLPVMHWSIDLLPPVNDYVLWLDFGDSDAMYLADGSHPNASTPVGTRITQVVDKSTLGNNALTFPAGGTKGFIYNRPLAGNGLNGRSTVESDGTGVLTGGWNNYNNLVVYVIFQCRGNVVDKGRIFSQMTYDNAGGTWVPLVYNNSVSITSLSTTGGAVAGMTLGTNVWKMIQHQKSGLNAFNKVNDVAGNAGAISVGDPMNPKLGYLVGGQLSQDLTSVSALIKGLYAEIIAFNRILTAAEEKAMSNYFKAKWGNVLTTFASSATERPLTAAELDLLNPGIIHAKRTLSAANKIAAIKVASPASVDWGDGSPLEDAVANVQLEHTYAATTGEVTATITSKTAASLNPNLSVKHTGAADAGWHEIVISDHRMTDFTVKPNPSLRVLRIKGDNKWKPGVPANFDAMPDIEEIELDKLNTTDNQTICANNTKLKKFACHSPLSSGGAAYAFSGCKSIESIQWDFSGAINTTFMFKDAHIAFNPVYDLPRATDIASMFNGATGFTSVTITGTSKVTNGANFMGVSGSPATAINRMDLSSLTNGNHMFHMDHLVNHPGYIGELTRDTSYMFYHCSLLETIGDIGMANVTNTSQMFSGSPKVRSLTLRGLKVSIAINDMKLDSTALDAVFTSLGTANAGATINIHNNPGAATCNTTIATAKGWTVTK